MRPNTFGRALGIGVRVAGKALLADKAAGASASQATGTATGPRQSVSAAVGRAAGARVGGNARQIAQGTRGVGRGARNFGRAVWNPFALASSVLWLEVTGMFFALFALFFAQHLYEQRGAWRSGPEHTRFLLYAGLLVLFVYFSISSFVRARGKQKQRDRAA